MNKTTSDVFLSYDHRDARLVAELAATFRAHGLEPFSNRDAAAGQEFSDTAWEALAESRAVVVVVSGADASPAMAVEFGGARAWNKPIFVVVTDPRLTHVPAMLSDYPKFAAGRVQEIIDKVKKSREALTSQEAAVLADVYAEAGIPADRLSLDHFALSTITDEFAKRTARHVPGERLLSALLRMRKQGALPRIKPIAKSIK